MAVQITDENLAYYLSQLSDSLENTEGARGCIVVTDLDAMKRTLVIPGVNYDKDPIANADAVASQYVQIPLSVLSDVLEVMQQAAASSTTAAGNAERAAADALSAVSGAENVDARLSAPDGIVTLTVTDRTGTVTSMEVGFYISKTYASVAAMNADAANVKTGRFVMIAGSVDDQDTAKLFVKNSSGSFTYLTDLSGAQGIKGDKGDKGDDLHWEDMSEEDREELAQSVLNSLVFADVATCEGIIDELT